MLLKSWSYNGESNYFKKKLEFDMPAKSLELEKSLEMVISATPMEFYVTSEINGLKPAKSLDVCRRNNRGNNRRNEIDWSYTSKSLLN